jgi:hypothetical protein
MHVPTAKQDHFMQTRQPHQSPQPPSSSDRISLLRLAEYVSRDIGSIPAALTIREKWLTGALQFWVQWILGHSFGTSREAFISLGEEAVPPWFLHDHEERGLTASPSLLNDERCGLTFGTIINASEVGLYMDDRPAWHFKSLVGGVDSESAACLFTSRAQAAQFWPWLETVDQPKAAQGRRSTRGPNFAYDWEAALIEAACYILEHDLPEEQADLVAHIADWFGRGGPGETQIKAHIAPLYRKARRALGR